MIKTLDVKLYVNDNIKRSDRFITTLMIILISNGLKGFCGVLHHARG